MGDNPFTYRHDLVPDSPLVAVALRIAQGAHKGQSRNKADPSIAYISHPIMVHDLLRHFGIADDITLAVALLHDVLEDNLRYVMDPDKLVYELSLGLQDAGYKDAEEIAYYIYDCCEEVTNAHHMTESKRHWQVDHVGQMSYIAALIKIVDQMASALCHINMANTPELEDKEWLSGQRYKNMNVVLAAQDDRRSLTFWGNLYKVLFDYDMKIIYADTPEAADQLRHDFSFERAVEDAKKLKKPHIVQPYETVEAMNADIIAKGVISVDFDKKGNICSYACLSNPLSDKSEPRNQASIKLVAGLEATTLERRVQVGHREVVNKRMVRVNKISPPIAPNDFLQIARAADAVSFNMQTFIYDKGRELNAGRPR